MGSPLYGVDKDGNMVPLRVDERGRLSTGSFWWEVAHVALEAAAVLLLAAILIYLVMTCP